MEKLKHLTNFETETNHHLFKNVIVNSLKIFTASELSRVKINAKSREGKKFKGYVSRLGIYEFLEKQHKKELVRIEELIRSKGHELSSENYKVIDKCILYLENFDGSYADFDLNNIICRKDFVNDFARLVDKK